MKKHSYYRTAILDFVLEYNKCVPLAVYFNGKVIGDLEWRYEFMPEWANFWWQNTFKFPVIKKLMLENPTLTEVKGITRKVIMNLNNIEEKF